MSSSAQKLVLDGPVGPTVGIGGVEYDYYCGGGYLGLYDHPEMIEAACAATRRYGFRLSGPSSIAVHPPALELAREAADFFGTETASYNPSGYDGAAMLAAALQAACDAVFLDAESHYSIVEGAALAGKPVHFFPHRDAEGLAARLRLHLPSGGRPLVMTDGLFPISGAIPPLDDYAAVLGAYENALLCVDDAHAAGVLGPNGRGSLEHFGMAIDNGAPSAAAGPRCFACATLSKAFGAYGGIIPCSEELLGLMRKNSPVFRGAACPPPGVAAACARALRIVRERPGIRAALARNVRHVREGLAAAGFAIDPRSPSPVIALRRAAGFDPEHARDILFRDHRICATWYESYTNTPVGGALRVAVFANHEPARIDRLIAALAACMDR